MQIPKELTPMVDRVVSGNASNKDIETVVAWYLHNFPVEINIEVSDGYDFEAEYRLLREASIKQLEAIQKTERASEAKIRRITYQLARVAAIVATVVLIAASWYYYRRDEAKTAAVRIPQQMPVPGTKRATITLSNGQVVTLDANTSGIIGHEGQSEISVRNGLITYHSKQSNGESVANLRNTITIPAGGEYELLLADGSKVWLNSGSRLSFPHQFTGSTREVELTGEGYFSIVADALKPFHVKANELDVQVLGTEFNINAYAQGEAKTTLLEGKVMVKPVEATTSAYNLLHPGQQASMSTDGSSIKIRNVDTQPVIAWKEGYFQFTGNSLAEVMEQLSRWYDLEVVYANGYIPKVTFKGRFSRKSTLEDALFILRNIDIKYRIEKKKLIIED